MRLALEIATWSKDPSTKVGCIITNPNYRVISQGYNGFPKGTSDSKVLYNDRPEKYRRIVHAEVNALALAIIDITGCPL